MYVQSYITRLVVMKTVFEHESKVVHTLLPAVVDIVLKLFLDGSHIHGVLDHREVVLQGVRVGGIVYMGVHIEPCVCIHTIVAMYMYRRRVCGTTANNRG